MAKTIEVKVYSVDELSKEAFGKAFEKWWNEADYYPFHEENEDTLKNFCQVFDINMNHWEYGNYDYRFNFSFVNEDLEELSHIRLLAHLNRYFDSIHKGKYYSKMYLDDNGKYILKQRHSKVMKEKDGCPLTGYCMDYAILQPIYEFIKKPRDITFYQLIEECFELFFKQCVNDVDCYYSKDNFKEMALDNEWVYLEDGRMFTC